MPVHDYLCRQHVGYVRLLGNHYAPLVRLAEPRIEHGYKVTQDFTRPACPECGAVMEIIPPRVKVDAYEPFHEFDTTVEDGRGGHRVEHIDSLRTLRRVERESEARHRNGEGRPMAWRDYSQDRSNRDVHTLATDPTPTITPEMRKKIRVKAVDGEPAAGYGPGVSDANTSAL